jgi:hypothetical protein
MEMTRSLNLYINATAAGGYNAAMDGASSSVLSSPIQMVHKDKFQIRLYFRSFAVGIGVAHTAVTFPAGATVVLAGKKTGELKTGDTLFMVSSWTLTSPEGADAYYLGTVNLNTTELNAAMEAETADAMECSIDIEVRDAGNTERLTFRVLAQVNRQVYDGEGNPTTTAFSGIEDVEVAASQVTVDLTDFELAAAPKVYPAVVKPSGSDDNIFVAGMTVTAEEIVFFLSAAPAVPGYTLSWILAQ